MLPTHQPPRRRAFSPSSSHSQPHSPLSLSHSLARLRSRSRFTNLAVILLSSFTALSVLLNLRYLLLDVDREGALTPSLPIWRPPAGAGAAIGVPRSIDEVVTRPPEHRNLTHMVMVAGHAVWNGCFPEKRGDENDWVLEPAQKPAAAATVKTFWSHIVKGAELALTDEASLLVFSGGQTRALTPHLSEAASYLSLSTESNVFQSNFLPHPRVTTEDYSLDSYQNLIFSLSRFREVVGRYPERITVVGFGMKERRFSELHRRAIRWPQREGTWRYVGVDIEGPGKEAAAEGELQYGYLPFTKDLYGCHGSLLDKKRRRNPHSRHHPFHTSAPELRGLLEWCPPDGVEIYKGPLPWDPTGEGLEM